MLALQATWVLVLMCKAQDVPEGSISALETSSSAAADTVFSTIIDQNLEVTGRIYESCSRGDMNARWTNWCPGPPLPPPPGQDADFEFPYPSPCIPNKHCYSLFLQEKTWFQAKRACENIGGYLVSITSRDEMEFIWSAFGKRFAGNAMTWKGPWIGLSDAVEEGSWQYINGETGAIASSQSGQTYNNWYNSEPDNCCGGEDCAHIAGGKWGSKWNDNKCHFNLPYICEKNY